MRLPNPDVPVIVTERLELWLPSASDIQPLINLVMHEETSRFLGADATRADHFTRIQRNAGCWMLFGYGGFVVRQKGCPDPIGSCGVFHSYRGLGEDFDDMPEAGWIIAADQGGKGYAREAMDAALQWFEVTHGQQPIMCMIEVGNAASFSLAARLSFEETRTVTWPDGVDVVLFTRAA